MLKVTEDLEGLCWIVSLWIYKCYSGVNGWFGCFIYLFGFDRLRAVMVR